MSRPAERIPWLADLLATGNLDALSEIGLADLVSAAEAWRRHSPAQYRALLDAIALRIATERVVTQGPGMVRTEFTWDAQRGRFRRGRTGHIVPRPEVDRNLLRALAKAKDEARISSQMFRAGKVGLEQWQATMQRAIKDVHLYSAANARGGWAQMNATDWGHTGPTIRFHYGKLQKFANEIAAGTARLDGRFLQRVELYLLAGRQSYFVQDLRQQQELGMKWEKNKTRAAEHCADCEEQSALGWRPIGTLVRPGSRACLTRCKCYLIYQQ